MRDRPVGEYDLNDKWQRGLETYQCWMRWSLLTPETFTFYSSFKVDYIYNACKLFLTRFRLNNLHLEPTERLVQYSTPIKSACK